MNLIKTELYKIKKSTYKNMLILSFLAIFILSAIPVLSGNNTVFFSNIIEFYRLGIGIIIPVSIAIFTLSSICDEYSNKTIKYLITSDYSRYQIVWAKFVANVIYTSIIFFTVALLYFVLNFLFSDVSNLYLNFIHISKFELVIHMIESHFYIWLYIISIISFSLMLGIIFKRQDISILIFILVLIFAFLINHDILRYTFFMGAQAYNFIGTSGLYSDKLINIISSISSISLSLFVSCSVLEKFEY